MSSRPDASARPVISLGHRRNTIFNIIRQKAEQPAWRHNSDSTQTLINCTSPETQPTQPPSLSGTFT